MKEWLDQIPEVTNPQFQDLKGDFHAHLTVSVDLADLDALRQTCLAQKVKLTVVELENLEGRTQTDVMATCYFRDFEPGAVKRIAVKLAEMTIAFEAAGFDVIRAKLEHESLPSLPAFDREHYHEIHVKLSIPAAEFDRVREDLLALGKQHDFVPSRNPRDRREGLVTQFVNKRLYSGEQADADLAVSRMLAALEPMATVLEVKRETVVFDTMQQHDRWWI